MLFGTIGIIFGVVVILFPIVNLSSDALDLIKKPEFFIWLLINCTITAFFAITVVPLWKSVIQLKNYFTGNKLEIALSLLLLIIVLSAVHRLELYYTPSMYNLSLPSFTVKVGILTGLGVFVALLAITGIWLVYTGLRSSFKNIEVNEQHIQSYLRLQEYLQQFLWLAGVILGLTILAGGALSKLHLATEHDYYPMLFVLANGTLLTIILTVIYVPVYLSRIAIGRQLCDVFFKMPSPNSKSWADIYSKRKKLEELLQLRITTEQNLRATTAIFIPLLSGVVSALLG